MCYFLLYFLKKLVGSCNCLNRGERMFFVEAAAAWEARSCFGHNLGAKSLVAAVQLHLRVRAAWASNWPHGHPSLSPSCWALRGKTKVLTWNLSIGKGRRGYSDAALPLLMPSGNLGCWTVPVTSHFYFHLTASSTCVILKYLLLFSDLCISCNEATSNWLCERFGRSSFVAKRNSLKRWHTCFAHISPCH